MNGFSRLLAPIGASLLLIALTFVVLYVVQGKVEASNASQLKARLTAAKNLSFSWQRRHLTSVREVADQSIVRVWVADQLRGPIARSAPHIKEELSLLYLGMGYAGHLLFDAEHRVISDSGIAHPHTFAPSEIASEALIRSQAEGASTSRPFPAAVTLLDPGSTLPKGTLMQMACARVDMQVSNEQPAPVLCLLVGPEQSLRQWLTHLGEPVVRVLAADAEGEGFPQGEVSYSYAEDDRNDTGKSIARAAQWVEELGVALVVEQDLYPLYAPYRLARNLIVALSTTALALLIWLVFKTSRDRKRLEDREALYRQVLDHLPLMVRIRDPEGKVELENRAVHGSDVESWGSFDLSDATLSSELPALGQLVWEAQKSTLISGIPQERQFVLTGKDITQADFRAYRIIAFPIYDVGGGLRALGSLAVEETDQARARLALAALASNLETQVQDRTCELVMAKEQAEAATQAKANFLANMSHEIRSPLNAVVGLAHLARRNNCEPKVEAYLDKILKSAGHLQEVVGDILDFSKIEAGEMQIEQAPFSLSRLLDSVIDIVWTRASGKPLQLIVVVDPQLPGWFNGDPLRIVQILINFMDNAIKFTDRGCISLRVHLEEVRGADCGLRFEVHDSGIGIPAERLEEMFKPFQQMDDSITRRYGGTGLGLAICSQLATLLGGHIVARSEPNVGSLFGLRLTLETVSGAMVDRNENSDSINCFSLGGRRVLLVDDDELNRDVACEQLVSLGLYVVTATNGTEALQCLSSEDGIDLVLLDVQMPFMDGLETVHRLRPDYPNLPVIALTASNLPGDRERCLAAGMSDFLAKPVDPRHLEAMLERWLCRPVQRLAPDTVVAHQTSHLPNIEGLDQHIALDRLLYNHELYLNLLKRFVADYPSVANDLKLYLVQSQTEEAKDILHKFKSMAGTIGADRLQKFSIELEVCLRDSVSWTENFVRFNQEFDRLLHAVDDALKINSSLKGG